MAMGRRVNSLLPTNDGETWLMDAIFSLVTFLGFAVRPFLDEPHHDAWSRYADPTMVSVLGVRGQAVIFR